MRLATVDQTDTLANVYFYTSEYENTILAQCVKRTMDVKHQFTDWTSWKAWHDRAW